MKTDAIDDFLVRAKQLARSGSRDMRMTSQEVTALAINIGEMMTRLAKDMSDQPMVSQKTNGVTRVDGGGFTD